MVGRGKYFGGYFPRFFCPETSWHDSCQAPSTKNHAEPQGCAEWGLATPFVASFQKEKRLDAFVHSHVVQSVLH